MGAKIGAGIALDGEKEFKQAVSNINKDLKVLSSEMGKVTESYSGNANSMEALRDTSAQLNKQIEANSKKVDILREALENSKKEFGEDSAQTKNWQISLNNAETALIKSENAANSNTKAMDDLKGSTKNAGDSMDDAGKKAKSSGEDAENSSEKWSKLHGVLGTAAKGICKAAASLGAAATGAAAGLAAMTLKAAQSADDINTLSKQTGLSVEEIQKFQFATEQIDVPMETLTGSMAKLTKNMATAKSGTGSASDAFRTLGVSITDSNGELRNNQDVFNDAINALRGMKNATERDALAMQIFGKSAQDLNPLILGGADSLKELGDQAESAGLILSGDSLDSLNSLTDATDTFKATLSSAGSLFSTALAEPAAGVVNEVTGYIQQITKSFSEGGIKGVPDQIGAILSKVVEKIVEYAPKVLEAGTRILQSLVSGISQNIPMIAQSAAEIVASLTSSLLDMLPELLNIGIILVTQLILGIAAALPQLIPQAIDAVLTLCDTMVDNIGLLIDAAIQLITGLAQGLIDSLPVLMEKAPVIVEKLVNAIVENIPQLLIAAMQIVIMVGKGIVENLPLLVQSAFQIISSLVSGIIKYVGNMFQAGKTIVSNVWEAITQTDWLQLGRNVLDGVVTGIVNSAFKIYDAVKGAISGALESVKDFFGIHSPSTVFRDQVGVFLAQGIGVGFSDEMKKSVVGNMRRALPVSIGEVSATVSGGQSQLGGAMGTSIVQHNNYYSPKALSPSEAARQTRISTRRAIMALQGV